MVVHEDILRLQAEQALNRLAPRLATEFGADDAARAVFQERLSAEFTRLFFCLLPLYGDRNDFSGRVEQIVLTAAAAWRERPARLKAIDDEAAADPPWFQSNDEVGAVCYVDLFAGDLAGLRKRIGYLRGLGITYLHLMPLLRSRDGENDGGYAVSDYREVDPRLGTMADLAALTDELRQAGIRLCMDFVFNHTADDHEWARAARSGDPECQGFYRMFDDRTLPDQYELTLREIFPDRGPEHFIWDDAAHKWVWSTFYTYQWDLNFANPALFRRMLAEMLFLANQGVEILRLDAVPFVWKRLGTTCENLPEAHLLIQAFNALARIAAPALVFKSEAIVHPDEVARYVGGHEAQLSYHPVLMVLLWEALATRDTALLRHTLIKRFEIPPGSNWVNYIRCHDDIGWGFADEDAGEMAIDPIGHRRFLNEFYTGRFPGSFARGLPFQENLDTGDCRICGMTASLTGLEKALAEGDGTGAELAVRRILLLYGVIMTIGGLPLLYLGDEVALLNDDHYRKDPAKAHDRRWVHRPVTDWPAQQAACGDPDSPGGRVFAGLRDLIALRKSRRVFAGRRMEVLPLANRHVLGYLRDGAPGADAPVVVLGNFTERDQRIGDWGLVAVLGPGPMVDLVGGAIYSFGPDGLTLAPYQLVCLTAESAGSTS